MRITGAWRPVDRLKPHQAHQTTGPATTDAHTLKAQMTRPSGGLRRTDASGTRLDVLVTLIESWEARNHPLDLPDPIAAIHYHAPWRSAPDCSLTSCVLGTGTCIDSASFLMLAPWPIGDKRTCRSDLCNNA